MDEEVECDCETGRDSAGEGGAGRLGVGAVVVVVVVEGKASISSTVAVSIDVERGLTNVDFGSEPMEYGDDFVSSCWLGFSPWLRQINVNFSC